MKTQNTIETLIRKLHVEPNAARSQRNLADAWAAQAKTRSTRPDGSVSTLRRIKMTLLNHRMQTAAILVVALSVVGGLWWGGTNDAWALEQVLTALEKVKSIHIQGTILYGSDYEPMPCELWVQAPGEDSGPLRIRLECRKRIYIIEGERAFECLPDEGIVRTKYGPDIKDFKYWYDMATYSPWFTSQMVRTLKNVFSDWEQKVVVDPKTKQERILVTCHYVPTDIFLQVEIDGSSHLITNAKLYGQDDFDVPFADMPTFAYNLEIPPGTFDLPSGFKVNDWKFQKKVNTSGSKVIDQEAHEKFYALFMQAKELFQEKETCEEAMAIYQKICDTYPYPTEDDKVAYAYQMIGLCYRKLGQPLKEIEAYDKTIQAGLAHWTCGDLYYFLGRACMEQGLNAKAINAFENCLRDYPNHEDYEQFPVEKIQQLIDELKERNP